MFKYTAILAALATTTALTPTEQKAVDITRGFLIGAEAADAGNLGGIVECIKLVGEIVVDAKEAVKLIKEGTAQDIAEAMLIVAIMEQ